MPPKKKGQKGQQRGQRIPWGQLAEHLANQEREKELEEEKKREIQRQMERDRLAVVRKPPPKHGFTLRFTYIETHEI